MCATATTTDRCLQSSARRLLPRTEHPSPKRAVRFDAQNHYQTENGNNTNAGRIGTSITPEGEMTANVLLEALGTTIEPDLLVEALTHRSFSHEHPGAKNYERLEFLGDAVLELVSTETLYKVHPDMNEGQLAKMRAKAVSEESLSKIAREKLHVGPYILLGHGEAESGRRGQKLDSVRHRRIADRRDVHPARHRRGARRSCIISSTIRWRKSPPKVQPSIGRPR